MATYIVLINFTEQGIRNIKASPKRVAAATDLAPEFAIEIRDVVWALGAFDGALVIEVPNDQAITLWVLKVASLGYVAHRRFARSAPPSSKTSWPRSDNSRPA